MIWKVGKGDKVLIGLDLWIRIKESHRLAIPSFKISEPKKNHPSSHHPWEGHEQSMPTLAIVDIPRT